MTATPAARSVFRHTGAGDRFSKRKKTKTELIAEPAGFAENREVRHALFQMARHQALAFVRSGSPWPNPEELRRGGAANP